MISPELLLSIPLDDANWLEFDQIDCPPPPLQSVCVQVPAKELLIVNVCALEVPPPGAGLNTVTVAVPAVEMSDAVIVAVT